MKELKENEGLNEYIDRIDEMQKELSILSAIPRRYLGRGNQSIFIGSEDGVKAIKKYVNNYDTLREE